MEIIDQNGPAFRTKCLPLEKAARFARCLSANVGRFVVSGIEESHRATGDNRFFVVFAPVNPERLQAIADRQQDAREERAASEGADYVMVRDGDRPFTWVMNPRSGETYETTAQGCSCPDAQYRCQPAGILCKHSLALIQREQAAAVALKDRAAAAAREIAEVFGRAA